MIVRERPGPLRLLLAWKGSVVPHILPHILLTGCSQPQLPGFRAATTWMALSSTRFCHSRLWALPSRFF